MDDPLAVPCRRCRAPAGEKCKNSLGKNKQTCPERGTPRPTTVPVTPPRPAPTLFDFIDGGDAT